MPWSTSLGSLPRSPGRLAAAGEWILNEKRLVQRAGLADLQDLLGQPAPSLGILVSEVRARLELTDTVWS